MPPTSHGAPLDTSFLASGACVPGTLAALYYVWVCVGDDIKVLLQLNRVSLQPRFVMPPMLGKPMGFCRRPVGFGSGQENGAYPVPCAPSTLSWEPQLLEEGTHFQNVFLQ